MIEFTCVQCGRIHERSSDEAGTTVYCDCGQPNRIPWSAGQPSDSEPVAQLGPEALVLESAPEEAEAADVCFQHEENSAVETCADCGVRFCAACVVRLQGTVVCGACKNFRLRRLQQPTRVSTAAIVALVLALCGAPVGLCITSVAAQSGGTVGGLIGTVLPCAALVLGAVALVQIERDPKRTGRSLAITGIVTGLVGTLLSALLTIHYLS